jgi:hypothetical protein
MTHFLPLESTIASENTLVEPTREKPHKKIIYTLDRRLARQHQPAALRTAKGNASVMPCSVNTICARKFSIMAAMIRSSLKTIRRKSLAMDANYQPPQESSAQEKKRCVPGGKAHRPRRTNTIILV